MPQKIHIIDYGMGNIFSIYKRLEKLGMAITVSANDSDIRNADKLILPGVGHFGKAMEHLKKNDLVETLNEEVLSNKKPILGICLGMQLMAEHSEEGDANGLNWIPAKVIKFKLPKDSRLKTPQIGWNTIDIRKESILMRDLSNHSEFYFVHSYHCVPSNPDHILSLSEFGISFCSAIQKDQIFGVQYHPEKSHDQGQQLFKNFTSL